MTRFEQRVRKHLQDKEVAEGYQEMSAELDLMHAIEHLRKHQHISQEVLAERMGKKREVVSRLLSSEDANPTLDTLLELFSALGVTADITLRQSEEGEAPLKVSVELASL